jgi:hypothetical protein
MCTLFLDRYSVSLDPEHEKITVGIADLERFVADKPRLHRVAWLLMNGYTQEEIAMDIGVNRRQIIRYLDMIRQGVGVK